VALRLQLWLDLPLSIEEIYQLSKTCQFWDVLKLEVVQVSLDDRPDWVSTSP